MRLLPKKVVNTELAEQKKTQIDEGVALARKIDTLRETLNTLQNQYNIFIAKSTEDYAILKDDFTAKKFTFESEIKGLEEKRRILQLPLDDAWANFREKETQILKIQDGVIAEFEKLEIERKKSEDLNKKERDILRKIKTREHELDRAYDIANTMREQAETLMDKSLSDNEKQLKDFAEREALIVRGQLENEFNLKANQAVKERQDYKQEELFKKEIQLKDREQTLERAFNRLK